VGPTASYLRRLPLEHFPKVLSFSIWVLGTDAEEGFRILTADDDAAFTYPRDAVVEHLRLHAPALQVRYLEHVILHKEAARRERAPALHEQLVNEYVTAVAKEIRDANGGRLIEGTGQ
jgi:hypothetical protein